MVALAEFQWHCRQEEDILLTDGFDHGWMLQRPPYSTCHDRRRGARMRSMPTQQATMRQERSLYSLRTSRAALHLERQLDPRPSRVCTEQRCSSTSSILFHQCCRQCRLFSPCCRPGSIRSVPRKGQGSSSQCTTEQRRGAMAACSSDHFSLQRFILGLFHCNRLLGGHYWHPLPGHGYCTAVGERHRSHHAGKLSG